MFGIILFCAAGVFCCLIIIGKFASEDAVGFAWSWFKGLTVVAMALAFIAFLDEML